MTHGFPGGYEILSPHKLVPCQHKRTHMRINPDEPHIGPSVEVCDDCGLSRSHWEQGASGWLDVDVSAFPRPPVTHDQRTDSDCFRCCLATLLRLPYDGVPDFYGDEMRRGEAGSTRAAWQNLQAWLLERGYAAVEVFVNTMIAQPIPEGTRCILSGVSPRNPEWEHAVIGVWRDGNWQVDHDPHASRAGVCKITTLMFLAKA